MPLDSPQSPEEVLNQAEESLKNSFPREGSSSSALGGSPSKAQRTAILCPSIYSGGPLSTICLTVTADEGY